jgi:hypothetical protein
MAKNLSAVGGNDELLLHVVQCGKCLEGNELFHQAIQRYFNNGQHSAVRKLEFEPKEGGKKKKKSSKFPPSPSHSIEKKIHFCKNLCLKAMITSWSVGATLFKWDSASNAMCVNVS